MVVVDAVRDRPTFGVDMKIVIVDRNRFELPRLTRILEVPDQLLLLRVHTDHRITPPAKFNPLTLDIPELLIPFIGVWRLAVARLDRFEIDP
ncbi:hypothetical protein ES703_102280 [subsurface metagenome]